MWLIVFGVILSVLLYVKLVRPCFYWKERGVKHGRGWPLVGGMAQVLFKRKHIVDIAMDLYKQFPNERYVGYMQFTQQRLLIRDLDLIKQMAVKDFSHFHDHKSFDQPDDDLLTSKSLIMLSGEKWRDTRAILSPAFTGSKIRNMYHLIAECAENFVAHFHDEVEVEMSEMISKFSNDVIASVAFGIKIDSLNEPKNEFYDMGKAMTTFNTWQLIKLILASASKRLVTLLGLYIFPKHATCFFRTIIRENIAKREAEGIVRPDLIHLLMEARKGKLKHETSNEEKCVGFATAEEGQVDDTTKEIELTEDYIVAQAMLFFLAAFDTVTTACSFMAHELAVNPDAQKRLQEEIDALGRKNKGPASYDDLLSLKYLDQVVSETLRLWPPGFENERLCVKDYLIESRNPQEQAFTVEKGVSVVFPIMALHRDTAYFSEPDRFDPERFNDENKSRIVSGTYLPFGLGPRNCIGSRLALLEMKALFYYLLAKFDIVPVSRTEIPMKLGPSAFTFTPPNGFWLAFKPREDISVA